MREYIIEITRVGRTFNVSYREDDGHFVSPIPTDDIGRDLIEQQKGLLRMLRNDKLKGVIKVS